MSTHLHRAKQLVADGKYKAAVDSLYAAWPAAVNAGDGDEVQAILTLIEAIREHEPKLQADCDDIEKPIRRVLNSEGGITADTNQGIPITFEGKRKALNWLVNIDGKYSQPFADGAFRSFSVLGTGSWSDYADVVLQIMIADSLLNVEEKLDRLLAEKGPQTPS